jgi:nucleotide-binding universal stress UspA family protein
MISIKKILVPTDLSSISLSATAYAISLAKKHAAEVTVLHVLPSKAIKEQELFAPLRHRRAHYARGRSGGCGASVKP